MADIAAARSCTGCPYTLYVPFGCTLWLPLGACWTLHLQETGMASCRRFFVADDEHEHEGVNVQEQVSRVKCEGTVA